MATLNRLRAPRGPGFMKPISESQAADVLNPAPIVPATVPSAEVLLPAVDGWQPTALLARSELAEVFRARPCDAPPGSPANYVLKRLRSQLQDDPRARASFQVEASLGRSLSHPHLVPVLACQVRHAPVYVVMPFLEGETCAAMVARAERIDLPEVLWFVRQAAEALLALVRQGWMHGDVKSANLLVSPRGHVTLLDLGFARRLAEPASAVDRVVVGTPEYLAPEQITSRLRCDIRSDLYSLGVVAYELLTGRRPFSGASLAELAAAHRRQVPREIRSLAPEVPGEVSALIESLLAKDPLRRPQHPQELIERLLACEIGNFAARAYLGPWASELLG